MKNWQKWTIGTLLILLAFVLQITFLGELGLLASSFNLVLATLVVFIFLTDLTKVLLFTILAGALLDFYSNLPFGMFLLTLFLVVVVVELLFLNFFTNRSFYSLILIGVFAVVVHHLVLFLLSWLVYIVGWSQFVIGHGFWLGFVWQLIFMAVILAVVFGLLNNISKRFKPIFLQS